MTPSGAVWIKFTFEVATVPVAAVPVSSMSVCAIARVVARVSNSTSIPKGYEIGVISLITYMGIAASSKK